MEQSANNGVKSTGILKVLDALIDKNKFTGSKELQDNLDEWIDVIFKKDKGFNEGRNSIALVMSSRRLSEDFDDLSDNIQEVTQYLKRIKVPKFVCDFNLPQVRSRLEKLMGTNYVSLTDREYMQRLQERILEDYEESMEKRIKVREEEEMERVKNLVLVGKIPLDKAPKEMANHPIMLIESYCNELIAERRAKIKVYKVKIPTYLYLDDTPDPRSGLSIELGHAFRKSDEKLCHPFEIHLQKTEEEEIEANYMMPEEEYDKVKYENALVKRLLMCETVEEMYSLADDIIGILKTIECTVPKANEVEGPSEA